MTQDFTAQTADNLGADKIARSSTAYALYNNGVWAGDKGKNTIDTTTEYTSGSGTYNKPAGYDDDDTIMVRMWGAGGSGGCTRGSTGAASGGEGGTYLEVSFRYSAFPSMASYSVGAAGAAKVRSTDGVTAGDAGGDSTVTIGSMTYTAKGGSGGTANATGTVTTTAQSNALVGTYSLSGLVPWSSGNGGGATDSTSATAGGGAAYGGGGGGGASRSANSAAGGASLNGGAGGAGAAGAGAAQTGVSGTAPAGAGGAASGATGYTHTSGAGAAGKIQFIVMRGWRPSVLSGV